MRGFRERGCTLGLVHRHQYCSRCVNSLLIQAGELGSYPPHRLMCFEPKMRPPPPQKPPSSFGQSRNGVAGQLPIPRNGLLNSFSISQNPSICESRRVVSFANADSKLTAKKSNLKVQFEIVGYSCSVCYLHSK